MITQGQRRICRLMVKLKLWKPRECMWTVDFDPCWGTRWLHRRIRRTQPVDDLHHAPACLANHYHRARIVYGRCNCGAQAFANEEAAMKVKLANGSTLQLVESDDDENLAGADSNRIQ